MNKKYLKFINNINWPEVFQIWQDNEASQGKWKKLYQAQGFSSWQDWRQTYIQPLKLDELNWQLYKIKNPLAEVPNFFGGPFKKWKEHFYKNKNTLTFQKLSQLKGIKENQDIRDIANNFPVQTNLIGLYKDEEIYIIDGMHRCCAIALLAQEKKQLNSDIQIAMAKY